MKFVTVDTFGSGKALLGVLCVLCGLNGATAFPEDAQREYARHDDCPNFTGTYRLYGDALPGMPPYLKFRNSGLALDEMLGLDLNVPERWPMSEIHVVHTDTHTLSITIVGSTASRTRQLQQADKVVCKDRRLIIEQLMETKGEATTGQALIIDQLEFAPDGALIVRAEIRDRSTFLFFDVSSPPELYGARFQVVR